MEPLFKPWELVKLPWWWLRGWVGWSRAAIRELRWARRRAGTVRREWGQWDQGESDLW